MELKLSEKIEALKQTLLENYKIGEFIYLTLDEFKAEAIDLENRVLNEGIRESERFCPCTNGRESYIENGIYYCSQCGRVIKGQNLERT